MVVLLNLKEQVERKSSIFINNHPKCSCFLGLHLSIRFPKTAQSFSVIARTSAHTDAPSCLQSLGWSPQMSCMIILSRGSEIHWTPFWNKTQLTSVRMKMNTQLNKRLVVRFTMSRIKELMHKRIFLGIKSSQLGFSPSESFVATGQKICCLKAEHKKNPFQEDSKDL